MKDILYALTSISRSSKQIGRYEEPIIESSGKFFRDQGWSVFPHSSFNVAWGRILSDVDILMVKGDEVAAVEVKSSHDNLHRSHQQIRRVLDYVDYVYVATNTYPRKWRDEWAGLLYLGRNGVRCITKAKRIDRSVQFESIASLRKDCLLRSLGHKGNHLSKYDAAELIASLGRNPGLKDWIKHVALCNGDCSNHSTVWRFLAPSIEVNG